MKKNIDFGCKLRFVAEDSPTFVSFMNAHFSQHITLLLDE
jgi:hypothetical protein